jgi:hypothetical protein
MTVLLICQNICLLLLLYRLKKVEQKLLYSNTTLSLLSPLSLFVARLSLSTMVTPVQCFLLAYPGNESPAYVFTSSLFELQIANSVRVTREK